MPETSAPFDAVAYVHVAAQTIGLAIPQTSITGVAGVMETLHAMATQVAGLTLDETDQPAGVFLP